MREPEWKTNLRKMKDMILQYDLKHLGEILDAKIPDDEKVTCVRGWLVQMGGHRKRKQRRSKQ